jgi:hypothetical protein
MAERVPIDAVIMAEPAENVACWRVWYGRNAGQSSGNWKTIFILLGTISENLAGPYTI